MTSMDERARADELGGDMAIERDVPIGPGATRPDAGRPWLIPVLIGALVVALSVAAVFGTLYISNDASLQEVGELLGAESPAVEERAVQIANLLLNYDSATLDRVAEDMLEISTGNFREQFEEILSQGGGLGTALEEASASSRGEILSGPDVYFRTASEAIAILQVTQIAQSSSNPGGQTIDYILKITLIDTSDGGWKADRVEVLSTTQA
jgi:hypothetical protein